MEPTRTRVRRLESHFAFRSPVANPDELEPVMDQVKNGSSRDGAQGVRWRWVLAAGAVVGVIPYLLLYLLTYNYVLILSLLGLNATLEQAEQFGYVMGAWGMPVMHMLMAIFAAYCVVRRFGTAAVAHGALIALISVVVNQAIGLHYGPLDLDEVVKYFALALAGGLLGGVEGRAALADQEALYEASRGIGAARSPQAIVNTIGDNPVNPAAIGTALWCSGSPVEGDASTPFATPEAWTPWFLRGWPDGLRLEGIDVRDLVGSGWGFPRILGPRDLPVAERAVWRERGVRSTLLLTLVAPGDREIGLLAVTSSGRRFSRSAVRAYETIGAQAALALENLRLVEEARRAGRQAGVLRERQRMAHEIHDTLAQGFTSIVMNLEAAEGDVPASSDRAQRHLEQARLTARESLTEARRLVWALRPESLENASLPEALERLAGRWAGESGVAATVSTTGTPRPLPPEVETTLFRVAQEALNNVRKHAWGVSRVALTLSYMGDAIALDARDDGAGFDPAREVEKKRDRDSGGFGLKGMRERVEGFGGALSIESAPGEGSTLAVELPVVQKMLQTKSPRAKSPRGVEEVT
ncbi:MAG: GAF domain-containing sensor histidine kinase [Actinobacteria bacterium]|nr:GAF domain-containing sensor histidine kinase [Actinomycetota bacterium]